MIALLVASSGFASRESDLLFRGVKTSLTPAAQGQIAELVELKVSKDGKSLTDADGNPVGAQVRELHLNADTIAEVLVILSGPMYGQAGSAVMLYVKNARGKYVMNLGFPAADVEIRPTKTRGFSDLTILGPGFECPVWKWNGTEYAFSHNVKCG